MNNLVGRENEIKVLQQALDSQEAEMVAVIGRWRIGKTALVKHVYQEQIDFEATGVQNAPVGEQLHLSSCNRLIYRAVLEAT